MNRKKQTKGVIRRVAEAGILTAIAFVLSYLEAILPFSLGIPGVKLGLSHIVTIFALYRLPVWETISITLVRVFLSAMLFGNAASLAYSLTGALLSLSVMLILKQLPLFSATGVSIAGGVSHNLGQLLCAALLMETTELLWYLPILLVSGSVSGTLIGLTGSILIERVKRQGSS